MEIIFREMPHTYDEIVMGHKIWFPQSIESDAISATANSEGFTPLTAIARKYDWDRKLVETASNKCNSREQIAIINELKPTLLLVPVTKGNGHTNFLINDLVQAANAVSVDVLNFTHYGFVQNKLLVNEIEKILDFIMNKSLVSSVRVFVWDIDFRFKMKWSISEKEKIITAESCAKNL